MNILNNIPFIRISLAFAIGIIIASMWSLPLVTLLLICGILFCILCVLNLRFSFVVSYSWGLIAFLFLISLGAVNYSLFNKKKAFAKTGYFIATILENPQEKTNSYKSLLLLQTVKDGNSTTNCSEKALVYFEKTDAVKELIPGHNIMFKTTPQEITNPGNPCEFDYKKYLENKHIFRQVYLKDQKWKATTTTNKSLLIKAELIRDKLLQIYRNQNLGDNETEILSALTLGYKRNIDTETKRIFSAAGAMHVLAVSGLHVGIIFLIISYLLGFLRKNKIGKYLFPVISISALWLYAFITGLSPSVLRASTMFSLVILANTINRKSNIYNTLAASAFLLLVINPNNLFEVGFQLSYSAVFGIVFLQPRLSALWQVENKIIKFFWNLFTVSIAAQIATFPLTAFYFNQFPTYFLLSNFVVIPAAMILIPLGLGLLAFSSIPILGSILSFITKTIISIVFNLLSKIESLPGSTIDMALSKSELLLVTLTLLSVFFFLGFKKTAAIKVALTSLCALFISFSINNYRQISKNEIIVLNNKDASICLIAGRNIYAITSDTLTQNDYLYQIIQSIQRRKKLKKVIYNTTNQNYQDKYLSKKNELIIFNGETILIANKNNILSETFTPSIFISKKKNLFHIKNTSARTQYIQFYDKPKNKKPPNLHILSKQGAFYMKY